MCLDISVRKLCPSKCKYTINIRMYKMYNDSLLSILKMHLIIKRPNDYH